MLPTRRFPLVIDADGSDTVIIEDTEDVGALVGGSADGSVVASHVQISVSVRSATNHAIIINPDRTGGQTAEGWTIDGAIDAAWAAIVAGGCRHLRVRATLSSGAEGAIYSDGSAGTYGAFSGVLHLANAVCRSAGSFLNMFVKSASIEAFHCSAETVGDAIDLHDDSADFRSLTLANNIFKTAGKILTVDAPVAITYSDGNCFSHVGDFADLDGTAIADLGAWKTEVGQDAHSIDKDPLFADSSLALASDSPCFQQGRSTPNAGRDGTERALTIDQGAFQITDPVSVKGSFVGGRIRLSVNGSAPVTGI